MLDWIFNVFLAFFLKKFTKIHFVLKPNKLTKQTKNQNLKLKASSS